MPSTSYRQVTTHSVSGYTFGIRSRTTVGSFSRTNNTLTVSNAKVDVNITGPSGGYFYDGSGLRGSYSMPGGVDRRSNTTVASGNVYVGSTYSTSNQSFNVTVGRGDTSIYTNNGAGVGGSSWGNGQSLSIPAAGSPTGSNRSATNIGTTTATLNASVSGWGSNCTAGTGQRIEYKRNSDGSWTNLAYSTSTSHSRNVSGLTSNCQYNLRAYASNGAGNTASASTINFYTLPLAPTSGTPVFDATTVTIPTTLNTGGNAYSITKQYRYQAVNGAWSNWTTFTGTSLVITDLLPSTDYNIQMRSTTTAGTTTGPVISLTTLPAGKLVMPDGTVKSAIPRAVYPDGTVTMMQVTKVES